MGLVTLTTTRLLVLHGGQPTADAIAAALDEMFAQLTHEHGVEPSSYAVWVHQVLSVPMPGNASMTLVMICHADPP